MRSAVFVPLLGAAVVIVSGCGSAHPTSPSSPASSVAAAAPATPSTPVRALRAPAIAGVVRMASRHTSGMAALSNGGMRVSLAGTRISTMADSRGRFLLKDLPVGQGRLSIQGQGVDAGVAVDLRKGRALQIAVSVSGQSAKVDCENEVEEPDGNNNDTESQVSTNTCDDGQSDKDDGDGQNDDGEQGGSSGGGQ